MKRLKNKKTLAIAGGILGVAAIGGVIAYNQDLISFANIFGLDSYETVFTEVFDAPTNWQPCEEVTKTFTVTNNNSYPVAVRFKLNEYWRTSNTSYPSTNHEDSDLSLTFNKGGTQSPIAVINPSSNASDWELSSDGWYYLKNDLAAGATSSSYLQSVTMDCDFNMVESVGYSQNGQTGWSNPSAYADANYHIFITGQTIPSEHKSDWRPAPHTADCDDPNNDLLYDKIACATNGADTNMDYDTDVTSVATGLGVNTLASSVNDPYATYYYRGNVNDNNVLWADNCWKIIRTTETGGVKMIWMGTPSNGQCVDTSAGEGILGSDNYENIDGTDKYLGGFNVEGDFRGAGYTYSNIARTYAGDFDGINPTSGTYYFANDVSYSNGSYTLVDYVQGTYAATAADNLIDHHYFCLNGTTSCEDVAYLWYFNTSAQAYPNMWPRYILFGNSTTVKTLGDALYRDDVSSNAKNQIDSWFNTNIAAARRSDLEDTVFCNDRTFATGALTGKDADGSDINYDLGEAPTGTIFGSLARSGAGTPSLSCSARDSYTVASGKLTYPVALISYDEVGLAGGWSYNHYSYLHAYNSSADSIIMTNTMSPAGIDRGEGVKILGIDGYYKFPAYDGAGFNPVVSLKFGAKYSGSGTASDPYTISF